MTKFIMRVELLSSGVAFTGKPFVLTWELSLYDFQHMAPFLSMGFTESKEISLPQVDLKMGTVMSCDISQQIFLFALDKALNSPTHFHAVGICVSFLMSFSSESHLHGPSDNLPQTRPRISAILRNLGVSGIVLF